MASICSSHRLAAADPTETLFTMAWRTSSGFAGECQPWMSEQSRSFSKQELTGASLYPRHNTTMRTTPKSQHLISNYTIHKSPTFAHSVMVPQQRCADHRKQTSGTTTYTAAAETIVPCPQGICFVVTARPRRGQRRRKSGG